MTVDEVAGVLRVSRWVVSRACQGGKFPGASQAGPNRTWVIPPAALAVYAASRMGGAPKFEESTVEVTDFTAYTLAEVAERTRFSLRWIQDQVRAGNVRYCRPGRKPMMTEEQIAALVRHAETRTTADDEIAAERRYRENRRGRRRSTAVKAA